MKLTLKASILRYLPNGRQIYTDRRIIIEKIDGSAWFRPDNGWYQDRQEFLARVIHVEGDEFPYDPEWSTVPEEDFNDLITGKRDAVRVIFQVTGEITIDINSADIPIDCELERID